MPPYSGYPRLLELDDKVKQSLTIWLNSAINVHQAERAEFINEIIENQELYWAEPVEKERKIPFKGAANIVIPVAAIAYETVHANNMQRFRGLDQIINTEVMNPDWLEVGTPFERYLNKELREKIKFFENVEDATIDLEKQGTGIAKCGYERIVKYGVRETPGGEEEFPVVVRQGPTVSSVPLYRYLQPFSSKDAQTAPWCGEEHEDPLTEIKNLEESEFFYKGITEKLRSYITSLGADTKAVSTQMALENMKSSATDTIKWYEIWFSFDVDRLNDVNFEWTGLDIEEQIKGTPKEVIAYYHYDSQTLLGMRYNPYTDLRRCYRKGVYFPIEHRWRGVGICKQVKMFQYEITTQHRQRLDNATIANMRMFKVSKMSGYGPGETIFPGKMWFLDDMDHLDTIQAGEIYASSFNDETLTLQYVQQRTGVTDISTGSSDSGTPGTATDIMARIKEGKKRFDYTGGNVKIFYNELLMDIACEIQQYGPSNVNYFDTAENGELVRQFFTLPEDFIRDNLIIQIAIADEKNSDLTDRNNWTQVAGMFQQYVTGAVQLAQLIGDPMLLQRLAGTGLAAATMAFKQVLDSYKIAGSDRMIVKELVDGSFLNSLQGIVNGQGQPPNGNPGAANPASTGQANTNPGQGSSNGASRISPEQLMALVNQSRGRNGK